MAGLIKKSKGGNLSAVKLTYLFECDPTLPIGSLVHHGQLEGTVEKSMSNVEDQPVVGVVIYKISPTQCEVLLSGVVDGFYGFNMPDSLGKVNFGDTNLLSWIAFNEDPNPTAEEEANLKIERFRKLDISFSGRFDGSFVKVNMVGRVGSVESVVASYYCTISGGSGAVNLQLPLHIYSSSM